MTSSKRIGALAVAVIVGAGALSFAASPPVGRGFVDGRAFLDLASGSDEDRLVEVNIPPGLIRAVSKAVDAEDPDLARTIAGLQGVQAIVVQVGEGREKEALAKAKRASEDLLGKGWSHLARVREKDVDLSVLVLVGADEDTVEGLTVVGFEKNERQVIFANIAGPMKMSELGKILKKFDLPGDVEWRRHHHGDDAETDEGGPA